MKHKKLSQPHFIASNKVQNIKQNNLETNKGLSFDYAQVCMWDICDKF